MPVPRLIAACLCLGLLGCVQAERQSSSAIEIAPFGASQRLPASLRKPPGDGPFPAVVLLHDCSGLGPRSSGAPHRWAELLVEQGYVVILPDSFTSRGFPDGVCTLHDTARRSVNAVVRAQDAYGALAYLRSLPYVDGRKVAVMGGSHGGAATLAAMVHADAGALAAAKADGFAAGVALYPGCGARYGAWSVQRRNNAPGPVIDYSGVYRPIGPLLILIGEKDDWTPAEPCRRLAESARQAGYPVEIEIFPGAQHSFDSTAPIRYVSDRNNINAPGGRGATTGGDSTAWENARTRVRAFLAEKLAGASD